MRQGTKIVFYFYWSMGDFIGSIRNRPYSGIERKSQQQSFHGLCDVWKHKNSQGQKSLATWAGRVLENGFWIMVSSRKAI